MLSSVQSKLGALSAFQTSSSGSSTSASKFSALMTNAATSTAGTASTGSGVSISDAAKAAASGSFDFDFSVTNVNHTQAEFVAHYTQGADQISAMQGLPSGQYDFTNMSPKQFQVVENHLLQTGQISPTDIIGFPSNGPDSVDSNYTPTFSDQPRNWIDQTKQDLSYNQAGGFDDAAYFNGRALDILTQLMASSDKPNLSELPDWATQLSATT